MSVKQVTELSNEVQGRRLVGKGIKAILGAWIYELIKPYVEQVREPLQRELDEISALQKRDIRQYVFERATSYSGFVNPTVKFSDEKGVVFCYGGVGREREVVLLPPPIKRYYAQDEMVVLAKALNTYLETHRVDRINNSANNKTSMEQ